VVIHKRKYLNFFGYQEGDWVPCENCGATAGEFHHLIFKSQGGSDEPDNIMALCSSTPERTGCHEEAHNSNREYNERLKVIHREKYETWKRVTGK